MRAGAHALREFGTEVVATHRCGPDDQAPNRRRRRDRELDCDRSAVRQRDEMGTLYVELAQQRGEIGRVRVRHDAERRASVAARVVADDLMLASQLLDLIVPLP